METNVFQSDVSNMEPCYASLNVFVAAHACFGYDTFVPICHDLALSRNLLYIAFFASQVHYLYSLYSIHVIAKQLRCQYMDQWSGIVCETLGIIQQENFQWNTIHFIYEIKIENRP